MHTKPAFTETKFIVTIIFVTSLFMRWGITMGMYWTGIFKCIEKWLAPVYCFADADFFSVLCFQLFSVFD